MIDLIKDKKSPWHETYIWSKDCDSIREKYIKDRSSIDINNIERYFSNLRLNGLNVSFRLFCFPKELKHVSLD